MRGVNGSNGLVRTLFVLRIATFFTCFVTELCKLEESLISKRENK